MEAMWMYGMFGGGGGLLLGGLAVIMVWVAAARAERIAHMGQFRFATILLSIAIVLPALGMALSIDDSSRSTASGMSSPAITYIMVMQLVAIAVALAVAVNSMLPGNRAG